MYDAIVIGARCAGSPLAMLLARRGHRVLLLDKAHFPSDTMSTHFVQPPAVARLGRWGLLDRLHAAGTPPITEVTIHMIGAAFSPPRPADAPPAESLCPRRIVLDKILVDAAVEAGAELREGFSVSALLAEDGRVTGVRGTTGGADVSEQARIVIGADGMRSLVARTVRAPEYNTKPKLTFGYYAYWSGIPRTAADLYFLDGYGILAFPTNDGCVCIGAGAPLAGFEDFRKDIEGNYLRMVAGAPEIAPFMADARREEPYQGTADQPNFFRKPYGPGWALVGDAGYHRDFITGLGITDAFRDAELLADAIDEGFSGRAPLDDALAAYERRRNEIATPLYEFTTTLAAMSDPPTPEMMMSFGLAMSQT